MAAFNPIAKNQFLVTVKGIDSYWDTCSGIKLTRQVSEYSDGISMKRFKKLGTQTVENVTIGKAFDPISDELAIEFYLNFCENITTSTVVTIQPMNYCPQVTPLGKSLVLYNAQPAELQIPEADKKSGDIAILQITFAVDDFEYK